MPSDYDVFRCNQFYFEDKYFLGSKIKRVFFNPSVFKEQFYTTFNLTRNGDYEIEQIVLSSNISMQAVPSLQAIYNSLVGFEMGYETYLTKLEAFVKYLRLLDVCEGRRPTSVVYMCAVAIAMGYQTIYLTGLDFYSSSENIYAFEHKNSNLAQISSRFVESNPTNHHDQSCDLEMLQFLEQEYGVSIYALSPNSPLVNYYPLAPIVEHEHKFVVEEKGEQAIKDILIPPNRARIYKSPVTKVNVKLPNFDKQLRQNIFIKILVDFVKIPSYLKHLVIRKFINKE